MSAANQEPLLPVSVHRRPARWTGQRVYVALVVSLVAATLFAIASSRGLSGRRGLGGVAPDQRAALLARTLDDLRQFCGAGHAPDLEVHCRELAAFAAGFEECRGECEALVRPLITPNPTR